MTHSTDYVVILHELLRRVEDLYASWIANKKIKICSESM